MHGLSPEVLPILMSHDFPGNIRELENIIEHAIVVCRDDVINIEHLPDYLYQKTAGLQGTREKGASLDDMERSFLYEAFRQNNWNRAATAAQLGIHTTTLWRKMKRLHLDLPLKDGRTRGK
jgi:transcriptional regulator with PAS, ATPase and Fis domain